MEAIDHWLKEYVIIWKYNNCILQLLLNSMECWHHTVSRCVIDYPVCLLLSFITVWPYIVERLSKEISRRVTLRKRCVYGELISYLQFVALTRPPYYYRSNSMRLCTWLRIRKLTSTWTWDPRCYALEAVMNKADCVLAEPTSALFWSQVPRFPPWSSSHLAYPWLNIY